MVDNIKADDPNPNQSLQLKDQTIINSSHSVTPTQLMNFIDLYQKVFSSGRYNFEACRIPLETKLNIEFFFK